MMAVVMNAQRGSGGFIFLALPFFILAGFIMDHADVGGRIVEFVGSLIGHVRGGLLQVMVVGVYLSSCISGSKAADMATIGIPMNRKLDAHGYEPHERAALLAASAAMAESVPPSIALILLGSATCDLDGRVVHCRRAARRPPSASASCCWCASAHRLPAGSPAPRAAQGGRAHRRPRDPAAHDARDPDRRHRRRHRDADRGARPSPCSTGSCSASCTARFKLRRLLERAHAVRRCSTG